MMKMEKNYFEEKNLEKKAREKMGFLKKNIK